LQEYALDHGQAASRFVEAKVHKPKQVDLGPRIMLDDERCILCTRCIRFTRDLVGDDALGVVNRGSYSTLTAYPGRPFDNNYTLNTVDICPVGALTSKDFRFQMRVWFLKETKSLCASCATGCNILIGSRENRIYRYTPRENDAVNGCWMCDHGRLNFHWINRQDRLRTLGGSRLPRPTWTGAVKEVTRIVRQAAPGSVAIVASTRQTNEELYLVRRLAQTIGAITGCVPHLGEGDEFLVHPDKAPNAAGARLLGVAAEPLGANLPGFCAGVESGRIRTLIVFGEDIFKVGMTEECVAKLENFVVSDLLPNRTTKRAHILLPGCAHVEKRGTFTNARGRVQRFMKAIEPPGDARPEWEWLAEVLAEVSGRRVPATIEALFNEMAEEIPAFRGLTWSALGDGGALARMPDGSAEGGAS
jgi:NADH-quinone oxidoreductase subunit G